MATCDSSFAGFANLRTLGITAGALGALALGALAAGGRRVMGTEAACEVLEAVAREGDAMGIPDDISAALLVLG